MLGDTIEDQVSDLMSTPRPGRIPCINEERYEFPAFVVFAEKG
jgi:hypothetical protein